MRPLPLPDPGRPPLTGPARLLLWQGRRQVGVLLGATLVCVVGTVAAALVPWQLGRIVDGGLADGLGRTLWTGLAGLAGLGLVQVGANVWGHRLDVENWLRAALTTSQQIGHHVTRTGDRITRALPTGEVVATVASDALRMGEVYAIIPRLVGGIAAYLVLGALLLSTSVPLGLLVLLGLPVVVGVLSLLVRPLQRRQAAQREATGRLTTLGADTVSGLRILRGIGGEDVFADRYRAQSQRVRGAGVHVAQTQSLLDALQTLLPGLFLAVVVWSGARLALDGAISPGQLVAFYGFAAFLTQPLWTASEAIRVITRAVVGARKIITVLSVPEAGSDDPASPAEPPAPGEPLEDLASGLVVTPGRTTAVVGADPDESARIALRLGRLGAPVLPDAAGDAPADEPLSAVRWGRAMLHELALTEVRGRVVVAESTPHLFTGPLADELDVRGGADRDALHAAMAVADAADVLDSVPGGLDGEVEEKGRSLSGGQRQRVALARALLTGAEVLVLIEPTSAVDAHTEARIARTLTDARRGATTVVVTASPLVLDAVDEVALVQDGRVIATGRHRDLVTADDDTGRAYRAVVSRTEEVTREAARR
ncbi:ABC transporter transmembrane domain-containing protein [Cellulomonas triticagri]|uniref:ABC transporter ATP-binding protein n=1 Tax=Cellulomonas triticagri TaxID=2483352 RepID=A0A3M2JFY9_9CELL|nr:ABC transporter ATP-binding protein [Cellulomonas triticagri]RMI09228.1 ABC transporter ATP-binding protein [Cellulomonas triticagri]